MIPGIWFELEVASDHSDEFKREEMMLKRDGYPITVGPVSYTHLDVYKRQSPQRAGNV